MACIYLIICDHRLVKRDSVVHFEQCPSGPLKQLSKNRHHNTLNILIHNKNSFNSRYWDHSNLFYEHNTNHLNVNYMPQRCTLYFAAWWSYWLLTKKRLSTFLKHFSKCPLYNNRETNMSISLHSRLRFYLNLNHTPQRCTQHFQCILLQFFACIRLSNQKRKIHFHSKCSPLGPFPTCFGISTFPIICWRTSFSRLFESPAPFWS